jgi:hypothetical protein
VPLVGGPQIFGDRPVADCNSRVRLGNRRDACSCKGEPAPILAPDRPASPGGVPLDPEKGDLLGGAGAASSADGMDDRLILSG